MQALPDLFSLEVSHLQRAENDGDGLVNDLFTHKAISLHKQM